MKYVGTSLKRPWVSNQFDCTGPTDRAGAEFRSVGHGFKIAIKLEDKNGD